MKCTLTKSDDRVSIANIPRLEWGKNVDNSFVRSAQLTLNSLGENYTYDFLMGISGAAFQIHFHPDFCPSSADSTTGFDVSRVLFKSLGYKSELYKINDHDFEEIRSLYQKIISQINKGIPIVAINLKVCPEWGIVTGYLKNKPGILCRTYFDDSDEYSLAEHAPWLAFFVGEKGKSYSSEELFRNSLRIAIKLAKTEAFEDYYSGLSALKKWIAFLEIYTDNQCQKQFDKIEENLTHLNILLDSRRSAHHYFNNHRNLLKLKESAEIIDNYKNEVNLIADLHANSLPGYDSKSKDWTIDILDKQIECLTDILTIEQKIVKLIEYELNQ